MEATTEVPDEYVPLVIKALDNQRAASQAHIRLVPIPQKLR